MLSYPVIWSALKIVVASLWIWGVATRWRSDWREFHTTGDPLMRGVIAFIWVVSIASLIYLLSTAWGIAQRVESALG